jgi:radical SAM family uncharacterized protein/radical SAM-linked protein
MNLDRILRDEILPRVQKPSRYLGNELNAARAAPEPGDVRIALAFPDLYDVGLSNLGLLILYGILNRLPGVSAERTYAPAADLEEKMRARGLPLFSWESRTPLSDFDAIGFTIQYELSATNILNMLDLAGLPLRAADRTDSHPLVLAGGPCVCNPEPYAYFMDAFVIGDGEDAVVELAGFLRETRGMKRVARLDALAGLPGVYVPAVHPTVRGPHGQVLPDPSGPTIRKSVVADLDAAPYPTDYIVPYTQQVHDRASLEVLRGCTQGCRFCQAGMTYRPVRERSLPTLDRLLTETVRKTGYDEISLASLSTCDYGKVKHLLEQSVRRLTPQGVAVALPSIRTDSFSVDLSDMVAGAKKSGITFAPEAATGRLRALIDKWIPDEEILGTTEAVFARGWERVKLYFMIGHPTETDEDVEAIARLSREVLARGRTVQPRAQVNVSVSTFVPKPFTPFQWERQIDLEETRHRQEILRRGMKERGLRFRPHDASTSWLEGIVSRNDRRVGDLFEHAWREGCRLDGWSEHFDFAAWRRALEKWGGSPEEALRERSVEEPLPWDHIDILVKKEFLAGELEKAKSGVREEALTADCRSGCHLCGVIDEEKELCNRMIRTAKAGKKESAEWVSRGPVTGPWTEPVTGTIRFRFTKAPEVALLSHLEVQTALGRMLRRAEIPVAFTQGYSPHLRLALSDALPVGMASDAEYGDVRLRRSMSPDRFVERMQAAASPGLGVSAARTVSADAPSLSSRIAAARYRVGLGRLGIPVDDAMDKVAAFLAREEVVVEKLVIRKRREKIVRVDIRPFTRSLVAGESDGEAVLDVVLGRRSGNLVRPKEILAALFGIDGDRLLDARVHKRDSLVEFDGRLVSVGQGWAVSGRYDPWERLPQEGGVA